MRPLAVAAGHAGHDVHPRRVGVGPHQAWSSPVAGSTARMRMSRWSRLATTSSGRPVLRLPSSRVTRYGSAAESQLTSVRLPSRVAIEDRDDGVGRACRRIADGSASARGRVRRVGDVPVLDRGLVNPRGQDRRAVRRPPVPAVAVHLLGRDELGQPEADPVGAVRIGERPVRAGGDLVHAERAVADIGDVRAGRVRARIGGLASLVLSSRTASPATSAGAEVGEVDGAAEQRTPRRCSSRRWRTRRCRPPAPAPVPGGPSRPGHPGAGLAELGRVGDQPLVRRCRRPAPTGRSRGPCRRGTAGR